VATGLIQLGDWISGFWFLADWPAAFIQLLPVNVHCTMQQDYFLSSNAPLSLTYPVLSQYVHGLASRL